MTPEFDWQQIDTVLLDMDGTLLDLYFDNYFWQEYLPQHWAELNGMDPALASQQLKTWYEQEAGTLPWYCLDFWTERLKFDVFALKADVEHLIQKRPHADTFLQRLKESDYRVIMVTNSHEKLIEMKMNKTGIDVFFDAIVSSHRLGFAKEEQAFWQRLQDEIGFSNQSTLLVDDNLTVLRAARQFGIANLLAIASPDSQAGLQDTQEFTAVHCFSDLEF
ncbi:MAG: GMP/IMP nucleotidase [Gammaproteobacteria bacterium]